MLIPASNPSESGETPENEPLCCCGRPLTASLQPGPFRSKGNHSMIVMKFGGSSVESAKAIQRVASIVRSHSGQRPAVVVSAMGKTTDKLLNIARLCSAGQQQAAGLELAKLRQFHLTEAA